MLKKILGLQQKLHSGNPRTLAFLVIWMNVTYRLQQNKLARVGVDDWGLILYTSKLTPGHSAALYPWFEHEPTHSQPTSDKIYNVWHTAFMPPLRIHNTAFRHQDNLKSFNIPNAIKAARCINMVVMVRMVCAFSWMKLICLH